MNKTLIFDLDGTLIDSLPDISHYVNEALEHFGYQKREYEEVKKFVGDGAKNLVKRCIGKDVPEQKLNEVLAYYNRIYTASGSPRTKIYEGIKEVLQTLKSRGFKVAIQTNKPQQTTDSIIQNYFSFINFDIVVGFMEGRNRKPDKTETINIMNTLNSSVDNTYFIGDSETDVQTAVNAGIKCISVLWGYREKEYLASFGSKIFASSPNEILELIK